MLRSGRSIGRHERQSVYPVSVVVGISRCGEQRELVFVVVKGHKFV